MVTILKNNYFCIVLYSSILILIFTIYNIFNANIYDSSLKKPIESIKYINNNLFIIRDNENNIFFATKISSECGYNYFYANTAHYKFLQKKGYSKKIIPLNMLVDFKKIQYKNSKGIIDFLEDKKYIYSISYHMCSHQVFVTDI